MNAFAGREQFVSDQGVRMTRLPLFVMGGLVAAVIVAWVLKFLFFHGWYLVMLVPVFGGLFLAGILHVLVGWAHCRNKWLAAAFGLILGCAAYLGYFYLCLRAELPPGLNAPISWLPRYIAARMANDVVEDVGRVPDQKPKKPSVGLNWYAFVFEWLALMGIAAGSGWTRAKRAYCFELKDWMQREVAQLPPYSGPALLQACETEGALAKFVAETPAGGDPQTACRLTVEFAQPTDGSAFSYPIYLSIEDLPNPKPRFWPGKVRRSLLRQCTLTPREVVDLRPLFPNFARLLGSQHIELRDLPASQVAAAVESIPAQGIAQITPVADPYRQKIRTAGYALKVNLLGLFPVVFIFGGLGALGLGGYLISHNAMLPSIGLFIVGGVSVAWGIYVGLYCMCVYENRWIERRLRSELATRPDSLVDPRNPDSTFVSIIPRENFSQVKLTMSSDLLLMKIDPRSREVLLEGDIDRYRIPVDSISVCEPQCFFHPMDKQRQNELWVVRLLVRVTQAPRELLLSVGNIDFRPMTNSGRRKTAENICQRILALRVSPLVSQVVA